MRSAAMKVRVEAKKKLGMYDITDTGVRKMATSAVATKMPTTRVCTLLR
jgi:hypothetical protein